MNALYQKAKQLMGCVAATGPAAAEGISAKFLSHVCGFPWKEASLMQNWDAVGADGA